MSRRPGIETVQSSYLGFPILISNRDITIYEPDSGRVLDILRSMKQVRLFIRGYRKGT